MINLLLLDTIDIYIDRHDKVWIIDFGLLLIPPIGDTLSEEWNDIYSLCSELTSDLLLFDSHEVLHVDGSEKQVENDFYFRVIDSDSDISNKNTASRVPIELSDSKYKHELGSKFEKFMRDRKIDESSSEEEV
jgi:hypothetical protein